MKKVEHKKSNFKILVIDDSSISINFVTETLATAGYTTVEQAATANEGHSIIQTKDFHLYIIDLVMPKISGIELAKEIMDGDKSGCVLMMSSLDSENVMIESIANGAKDFLPKPFTKLDLISSVDKLYEYAIKEKIF